jgi:hypothetical protein
MTLDANKALVDHEAPPGLPRRQRGLRKQLREA